MVAPRARADAASARPMPRAAPRDGDDAAGELHAQAPRPLGEAPGRGGELRHPRRHGGGVLARGVAGLGAGGHPLQDADQPEQVVCEVPVEIGQVLAVRRPAVERHRLVSGGDAERRQVEPAQPAAPVGREFPLHQQVAEIGQRIAERRQLPVEHRADAAVPGEDQVVEAVIAVDHAGALLLRHGAGQPRDQALDILQPPVLGGAVLAGPAVDLPGEVVAGPAVIAEPRRLRVDGVEARQRGDHARVVAVAGVGIEARQGAVPVHGAVDRLHHVEGRTDHLRVLAQREGARHRKPLAVEGADHPELAVHGMGGGEERAERLSAQHVGLTRRVEPIGRVRLAAAELLHGERAGEAPDVRVHPGGELRLVDPVARLDRLHAGEDFGVAHARSASGAPGRALV
jgi:hypothetical protein